MKIGIIVAMEKELRFLLPHIDVRETEEREGLRFHIGDYKGHEVVMMQCGIGKVNSALSTDALIRNYYPELVINSGVAGGADSSMKVLDIFVAEKVSYHDVWCGPGTRRGAADGFDVFFHSDERIVSLAHEVLAGKSAHYGLICSGDKFITTPEEIADIKSEFPDCLAVDMESAPITQVCARHGVPFAIIRVISDTPGQEENISQYQNFWTDAPMKTFKTLMAILEHLK